MLLSTRMAAERLGVDDSRVRKLIAVGRLKAQKIGHDWIINSEDLAAVKNRRPGRKKKGK
jgi:excisionase family DNA binding protein